MPGPAAYALLAALLFGTAMIVLQQGLRHAATLPAAAVSNLSTVVLFWLAAPLFFDPAGATLRAVLVFALVGAFFPALVTLLMFEGNRRMGPSVASAVAGTTPLFAYLGAVAFLDEPLSAGGMLGTLAIVAGIVLLAWRKGGMQASWPLWVLVLPCASAVLRALAHVFSKYGMTLWPNAFAAGLIGYTVTAMVTSTVARVARAPLPPLRRAAWFTLAGMLNGVGVLALYAAFRDGSVTLVSPIVATAPVITLLLSAAITRQERLTARVVAGVLATVAGVMVILLR